MSSKTASGYVNLVHKLMIALSEGKAEAEVDYVPVSRTPYVKVAHPGGYDALDEVRDRVRLELASRGFRAVDDFNMAKETSDGHIYIEIHTPAYDAVGNKAVLSCNVGGPYPCPQDTGRSSRNKERERRQYGHDVHQAEHDQMNRMFGMQSLMRTMLIAAPFEIPSRTKVKITCCQDEAVIRRVAKAFAAGGLECADDLVREADLYEMLGIDRPEDAPRP